MDDAALARLHHESRITAATGWLEEKGGEAATAALVLTLYDYAGFALRRGEGEHAEVSLRKALRLSADHTPSRLLLTVMMLEAGQLREAVELMHGCQVAAESEPLVGAVLVLLYYHMEEDELLAGVTAATNRTLAGRSPSDGPSAVTAAALGSLPFSQAGWAWDASPHVGLLGARYAQAFGFRAAAHVYLRAVIAAEEGRGVQEEKTAGTGPPPLTLYLAWLQLALLLSAEGEHGRAMELASRVIRGMDLLAPGGGVRAEVEPGQLMYILTRAAQVMWAGKRVDEAEGLLLAYTRLVGQDPTLAPHLPSVALLTRHLLAKQSRVLAVSLLGSLVRGAGGDGGATVSPWLHLLYAEALYADAQYSDALQQCSAASLKEAGNSRVYAQLCQIHCKLWKAQQAVREKAEAAEERRHRRSPAASSPFSPSPHLRSLLAVETTHRTAASTHYKLFGQLTAATPLPPTGPTLGLYIELGMVWYEREQWDQAEESWQAADAVERISDPAGGLAKERLEWVRAKRSGGEVEGESEARMIQNLFRRAKLKKDRTALEHKEVVKIIHKRPGVPARLQAGQLLSARVRTLD